MQEALTTRKEQVAQWFKGLQDRICAALETADGATRFEEDLWERPEGGGGRTRILRDGAVIAKGGVNFSAVHGPMPQNITNALKVPPGQFFATGVSIVMHPVNPHVPIIHMNVRYFEMDQNVWWFGGGIDLTPHYIIKDDARWFHAQLQQVCQAHDPAFYEAFKRWADDYFYIKHRQETRGVGGIFFDRLTQGHEKYPQHDFNTYWPFVQGVGNAFAPIYTHFMHKYKGVPYGEEELQWQRLRRGRYAEFNLVLDKGTKFGLDTNGRIESILMSLPPMAAWEYDYQPAPGSKEAQTLQMLKKDINWLA